MPCRTDKKVLKLPASHALIVQAPPSTTGSKLRPCSSHGHLLPFLPHHGFEATWSSLPCWRPAGARPARPPQQPSCGSHSASLCGHTTKSTAAISKHREEIYPTAWPHHWQETQQQHSLKPNLKPTRGNDIESKHAVPGAEGKDPTMWIPLKRENEAEAWGKCNGSGYSTSCLSVPTALKI